MSMSMRLSPPRILSALLLLASLGTLAAPQAQAQARDSASISASVSVRHGHAASALIKTAPARILVNAHGLTLYVFSADTPNKSTCTGECAKFWPPLLVPSGTKVPAAMSGISGKFGVTMRAGGAHQLTYDGAPVYTWIKDKKAGEMTGQGVQGVWWTIVVGASANGAATAPAAALVKTAPAQMLVNARGLPLYVFSPDKPNKSTCSGECAKFWPPLTIPKGMTAPATMSGISGKFGVTMRAGGAHQLTDDGAPLYTFLDDKKAGDMSGQGFQSVWWIVTA